MKNPLVSLADRWISRHAKPAANAELEVAGLRPAVVVTGGSRGIGRAIAHRFASAGHDVAVIARGRPALDEAADAIRRTGGTAVAIGLDVTQPDAAQQLGAALREAGLYTDILVNNAGVGLSGVFERHTNDDLHGLIALNVTAVTRLMRDALPAMLARGRGGILNVASLGGLVPGPHQAAYYASKSYVLSLTEAVAHEVRGRGVRVAALAPGPVNTRFHRAMRADNAVYRRFVPALSPEAVAASAYRQFAIGRRIIVPGVLPTAAALAVGLLPHAVTVPVVSLLLSDGSHRENI
jgi:uncharacterized protein